jgi:hypothetical protein
MSALRMKNRVYMGGLVALCAFFGSAPLILKQRNDGNNLTTQEKPLTGSQIMRGAFLNTGSKDVGRDKDWDNGVYVGKYKSGASFNPSAEDLAEARLKLEAQKKALGMAKS